MMGSMNSERYEGNGSLLQISPAKTDLRRLLEWTAALIGAMNCLVIPALFAQSGTFDFPFPLLYFIEIIVLGVLVLGFVALRPRLSAVAGAALDRRRDYPAVLDIGRFQYRLFPDSGLHRLCCHRPAGWLAGGGS
jgi:hypothetical protein